MILIYLIGTRLKELGGGVERGNDYKERNVEHWAYGKSGMRGFPSEFEPSAFQSVMASSNGNRLCKGAPIYRTNLDSPGGVSLS